MKLAIATYSLAQWKREGAAPEQILEWIAGHAQGVEFSSLPTREGETIPAAAERWRRACDELELTVVGVCCGAELLNGSDDERADHVEYVKRHIDAAAALGVDHMRHDVTRGFPHDRHDGQGERSFDDALDAVVPPIRELADYGAARGVKTTLENHGFYMQAPERVDTLLRTVDHDNFGLTLDVGNFLCVNADPARAIELLNPWVVHAHLKDFLVRRKADVPEGEAGWLHTPTEIALQGAAVGEGDLDLPRCLNMLAERGYDGWLGLEYEGPEPCRPAVARGLARARELLADVKTR